MEQGSTDINGPHQGAWIDTPDGKEDWFIHFQDKGPYGRVVLLEPMKWNEDGFPVIGVDKDGDGRGEPVRTYTKPNVGKTYEKATPADTDEFNANSLGLQWQWKGNPSALWYFTDQNKGVLRLFSVNTPGAERIYDMPNLLLQKFPARDFTATAKVSFHPRNNNGKISTGEMAGLCVMGYNYGAIAFEQREDGTYLVNVDCKKANKGGKQETAEAVKIDTNDLYLRVKVAYTGAKKPTEKGDYKCEATFYYSADGKKFTKFGRPLQITEGHWIGAKLGLFCSRPWVSNDSGWMDVDWFRVTK